MNGYARYTNQEVVYEFRLNGRTFWDVEHFRDQTFAALWVGACEIEDDDARTFALNSLADTIPYRSYSTYGAQIQIKLDNQLLALTEVKEAITNLGKSMTSMNEVMKKWELGLR